MPGSLPSDITSSSALRLLIVTLAARHHHARELECLECFNNPRQVLGAIPRVLLHVPLRSKGSLLSFKCRCRWLPGCMKGTSGYLQLQPS